MAGWDTMQRLVLKEIVQGREEGRDPAGLSRVEAKLEAAGDDREALEALHAELLQVPLLADFPYEEPSDLAEIRKLRPDRERRAAPPLADDELYDRLYGAWLGRCVGCALGKPVEHFMRPYGDFSSWKRQKRYLTAISADEWPLRDYIPANSPASEETGPVGCPASTREEIAFMETDDDIRYTVLGQIILQRFGPDFMPVHVAHQWFQSLPYNFVCTAETQAYRNMVDRGTIIRHVWKPEWVERAAAETDWNWIVHRLNPYREWIGAQIRVDSYGYACPGNPELAADMAWRDASISHVKNGIYGAMFCAAMMAEAFVERDPLAIVEAGLGEIPTTSRLYTDIRKTIDVCASHDNRFEAFEEIIRELYSRLGHYHPAHTNNNAALCTAAVLLSDGDFAKGITMAVMGGWDTDCNGATVGSIVGAITGAAAAPTHWTGRLNDTLNSEIPGYHPIAISECARRSLDIVRKVEAHTGAKG